MARKINILETIRQGQIGGGETYLHNLVSRMNRDECSPIVLAFTDGELITNLRDIGIPAFVIPTVKPFDFSVYDDVQKLIKEQQIDIVHMHGTRAATNSLIPAKRSHIARMYTVHGWSYHTGNNPVVTWMRKFSERYIIKNSNIVICGSKADLQMGFSNYPRMHGKLIYNSIDPSKFNPAGVYPDIRREFNIPADAFVITFLARITYQKDPLTFIRAAAKIHTQIPNVKFLFIGEGDMKAQADEEIAKHKLNEHFIVPGFRTDVANMLSASDVFVLPSLWEVVPLGLLEAMAMQKACIATDIPGTSEALRHKENGLLFTPGNAGELAEMMLYYYKNSEEREQISRRARATVEKEFAIDKLVSDNMETYRQVYRDAYGSRKG